MSAIDFLHPKKQLKRYKKIVEYREAQKSASKLDTARQGSDTFKRADSFRKLNAQIKSV